MNNGQGRGATRVVLWCVAATVVLAVFVQTSRMVPHQRKLAHESLVVGRLCRAALLIQNYEAREGAPPPIFSTSSKGDKLLSWRALVLLFDGPDGGIDGLRVDEPWNSPANRIAATHNLDGAAAFSFQDVRRDPTTQILAVVGPDSLWDAATGLPKGKLNAQPEMVMLVGGVTSNFHWMEPGDIREDELRRLLNAGETLYGVSTLGRYGMLTIRDGRIVIDPKDAKTF